MGTCHTDDEIDCHETRSPPFEERSFRADAKYPFGRNGHEGLYDIPTTAVEFDRHSIEIAGTVPNAGEIIEREIARPRPVAEFGALPEG